MKIYQYIFSPQQWGASWAIIHFLYTHWSTDDPTYICPWYSQHAPSPDLHYFIISYVDAPFLWNITMTMTGIQPEKQIKRLLGALLTNKNHNTRFEIAF